MQINTFLTPDRTKPNNLILIDTSNTHKMWFGWHIKTNLLLLQKGKERIVCESKEEWISTVSASPPDTHSKEGCLTSRSFHHHTEPTLSQDANVSAPIAFGIPVGENSSEATTQHDSDLSMQQDEIPPNEPFQDPGRASPASLPNAQAGSDISIDSWSIKSNDDDEGSQEPNPTFDTEKPFSS